MIGAVLVNECAKKLRSVHNWDDSRCEVSPNGQPWASSGDYFVGIFPQEDENTNPLSTNFCFPTQHAFIVRISRRARGTPHDRLHRLYVEETKALCRLANTVRQTLLDNRESIRASVNAEFEDDDIETDVQLIRTFSWLSTDSAITDRDATWFRSNRRQEIDSLNAAGYSIDINFGLATGVVVSAQ